MADPRSDGVLSFEARTAERLRDVTANLVSELDLERVVQRVVDAATELIGAEDGAFFYNLVDGDGKAVAFRACCGPAGENLLPPGFVAPDPHPDPHPGPDPDDVAGFAAAGRPGSYLTFPMVSPVADGLGALFFRHPEADAFTAEHEALLAAFAAPASIAIDNARLFRAAQRDREAALRLADRLAQMQAVSARLAGARTVDQVASVVVTGAAAAVGCVRATLYVLSEDGETLDLLDSFGYEGRLRERWARIDTGRRLPSADALRERRMVVLGSDEDWSRLYPDASDSELRSTALAVIPLAMGPHAFGIATFGWDEPRTFGDDDARFLEAVADQAAQALERARLYEVEREAARTLQQSLLPPRLPEIPGLNVAAVYRPGDRSVAVGGDFYDVFRLGPDRWGVAMGDVCGRGARAASRTALVRYTLRAVAMGEAANDPVGVLRRLNDAMLAEPEADDRFCATVFGYVEPATGGAAAAGAWVTIACAGHPRPVLIRRQGWLDLRGQTGTLVGVFADLDVSVDRFWMSPGESLVVYTDGISEARNPDGEQFADDAFAEALLEAGAGETTAGELVDLIRDRALDFSGGTLGDDFAVLVLRVPPGPEGVATAAEGAAAAPRTARVRLPSTLDTPRAARRYLARVLAAWGLPESVAGGDAALLLSELATNAVQHTGGAALTIVVRYDGEHLRVEVGDASTASPSLQEPSVEDERGRGLLLVDRIATDWGILGTAQGKRVWFRVPVGP